MKKLTQENFEDQIVRYGFFAEQLPPCFSTEQLADKLPQILEAVPKKVKITCPITISTYKNDISRRILSAPNPEAFLKTVKVY